MKTTEEDKRPQLLIYAGLAAILAAPLVSSYNNSAAQPARALLIATDLLRGGGFLSLLVGWLWKRELAEMHVREKYPVSSEPPKEFAYDAAKAAWFAPAGAFLGDVVLRWALSSDGYSFIRLIEDGPGPISFVGILAGCICAVIAFRASRRLGPKRLRTPTLIGLGISLILSASAFGVFDGIAAKSTRLTISGSGIGDETGHLEPAPSEDYRIGRSNGPMNERTAANRLAQIAINTKYINGWDRRALNSDDGDGFHFGHFMILSFTRGGNYRVSCSYRTDGDRRIGICTPKRHLFHHEPRIVQGRLGELVMDIDAFASPYIAIYCPNGGFFVDRVTIEKLADSTKKP